MILNPALIIAEMEAIRAQAQKLDSQAARVIKMVSVPEPKRRKRLSLKQRIQLETDRSLDLKFNK